MTNTELKNVFPDWKIVREIGRGSFGVVYEIEKDNFGHKEKSALKVISIPQNNSEIDDLLCDGLNEESITSRYENYMQDVVREYSMMADMNGCANIVYGDEVKYIRHDNRIGWDIFIRMELLTPLIKALGETIPDSQVIKIGMDICRALAFCKANKVIHRDIKPQNIFVARDGTYKLGDFGEAKTSDHSTSGAKTGTYKYMAPEVYNNQPYGAKADIYSLGMVLYWLLNERRTPFLPLPPEIPALSDEENARNKRFSGVQIPEPRHGSDVLKKIVLKACAFNTKDRYQDAAEMLKDLTNLAAASELAADVLLNTLPHERTNKKEETAGTIDNDDETVGAWKRETKRPKSKTDYSQEESIDEDTFSAKRNRALSSTGGGNQGKRVGRKRKTAETVFLTISVICICIGLIVLAKITGPIDPVQGFQVNTVGTTSAVLSWEKNKDAAAYELSYKFHSASEWNILKSSTSETKISINNLQAGKPYDFRIKAISGNSESEYTELDNIYTKYMNVSWLRPSEESENSIKLTWADNSSTNKFEITYCQTGQQVRAVNVYGTTYILENLEPGEYEFKIRAVGEGPASDYTSITYKLAKKYQIGDTVSFGSYEQDHAYNNSGITPIEWQILDIKDGNALLISKYALLSEYFSDSEVVVDKNGVTWQDSSLRSNLNGKFYSEAFSSAEKKHIVLTRLAENKEEKYCNRSCLATEDHIFLLSMSEADKYFKTNAARRCEPSKFVSDGAEAVMSGKYCEYWLRSATERIGFSLVVQADGAIMEAKGYHQNTRMPVRPAMWVELEGLS